MKLHRITSLLASTLAPRSSPPYWTCSTDASPGPGLPGLLSIQAVFSSLYGAAPLVLEAEEARIAICDGVLFGLWNGHPHAVVEQAGLREKVALRDPGEEGTECLGHADDDDQVEEDLRLSYMFGVSEYSWVSGGTTEIRRCEE